MSQQHLALFESLMSRGAAHIQSQGEEPGPPVVQSCCPSHPNTLGELLGLNMNVFKREVNSSCLELLNMEMVEVIMNMTGSTDNDFTMASEVLEEIGFTVGQKLMERYVTISTHTFAMR